MLCSISRTKITEKECIAYIRQSTPDKLLLCRQCKYGTENIQKAKEPAVMYTHQDIADLADVPLKTVYDAKEGARKGVTPTMSGPYAIQQVMETYGITWDMVTTKGEAKKANKGTKAKPEKAVAKAKTKVSGTVPQKEKTVVKPVEKVEQVTEATNDEKNLGKNGIKHDNGKVRLDLLPPEAVMGLGEVLTYGAEKYGPNNWQGVEPERYEAALLRHLMAWKQGSAQDEESGLSHLKHVLCNAAFLVALEGKDGQMHERG